jgi:hypothetical protein
VTGDDRNRADEVVVPDVLFRSPLLMSSSLEHASVDDEENDVPDPLLVLLLLHPLPHPLLLLVVVVPLTAASLLPLPNDPDRVWNWKDANSRKSGTRDSDPPAAAVPPLMLLLLLVTGVLQADAAADETW